MQRVITTAVLVPVIVAAIWWLPESALSWFLVVAFTACAWEYAAVNRIASQPWIYAALIGVILVAGQGLLAKPLRGDLLILVLIAVVAVWIVGSRLPIERRGSAAAIAGFGVAYFGVAVDSLVIIRGHGAALLLLLVSIVAVGDTAAFYTGRTFGKRKMAEILSPNKTWVGFFASLASAAILAVGWAMWQGLNVPMWLVLGLVTNLAAQAGDLLESAFKRQTGVKDSGNLLPGHGGIWDRVDAILLAAPAFAIALPG